MTWIKDTGDLGLFFIIFIFIIIPIMFFLGEFTLFLGGLA